MKNEFISELEKRLREENSNIILPDTTEITLIKLLDQEDMLLENIIISLYNQIKINQFEIKNLENNIDLLAKRIYKTDEDFTTEEKEEITSALKNLELEQIKEIDNFKGCFQDILYSTENDLNLKYKLQNELMNKIKYQTPKMNKTFVELVSNEVDIKKQETMNIEDILEIKTDEQMKEYASLPHYFKKSQLLMIAEALKAANGNEINDPKQFLILQIMDELRKTKLKEDGNIDNEAEFKEVIDIIKKLSRFQAYHLINMLSDLFE